MGKTFVGKVLFRVRPLQRAAAALTITLSLTFAGIADAQQPVTVSGTVTSEGGQPLRGVAVHLQGSDERAVTDELGAYRLLAPSNGVLLFASIGLRPQQIPINGRTTIDVTMERVAFLEEVVVTAYTEQQRSEITGAVASVDMDAAERQVSASVLKRLEGNVSGVRVETGGSPGSRSTVRIRGVTSFQNNDPLYVVDGVPVQDDYINWLNPNDITSIQVLKDASAASIYGSRASNGVVVIETTKRGVSGPPRATLRVHTGVSTPVRGYDDFLITDALQYHEILRRSYVNAGQAVPTNIYGDPNNPTVPAYIYPNNCGPLNAQGQPTPGPCSTLDESAYSYPNNLIMPGSHGTNWWDAVFGTGSLTDVNLDIAGGLEALDYNVSFNYFDQDGTAEFNRYQRGSVRVNTSFNVGRLNFGENLALSMDRSFGGMASDPDGFAEDGILGKNILMQPVVPVYDIRGNFASGKSVGLGNQTNPLKEAFARRDNAGRNTRLFGNVFAGLEVLEGVRLRSSFGFNVGQFSINGFNPIYPENSEPTLVNSIFENTNQFTDWTWSNTAAYDGNFEEHNISLLIGGEASRSESRFISAGMSSLINEDPNSWFIQDPLGNASTKSVNSIGGEAALLSVFGRADYTYDDRYVLSLTVRRDGSSRLGPSHRWGMFPAVGLGWRLSNESFMLGNDFFNDVMLRVGWGITGNQAIPSGRIISQFGGAVGDTYYDIGGANDQVVAGFRQTSLGNADLRWEENRSINVGADVAMLDNHVQVILDLYQRDTDNLLFDPALPATAGIAAPPIVNIGQMRNRGVDLSVSYRADWWDVTLNGSAYRNEIVRIDGSRTFFFGPIATRFGNAVINQLGEPIGSFYGYVADGFFRDAADVAAHATQAGAAPGRIKFRDVNGDDAITSEDRTVIGSPHPDFTAGLDVQVRRGDWDLSANVFGTFGNEIFDVQKEFYVFQNFSTTVRRDLLTHSWTPENPDGARYPRLDVNDNFSREYSSFYVEDGSYVRLRTVQLGYTVPTRYARWVSSARLFLQAENLFTITGYDGLDPSLPAANISSAAGDIRDQYRGIDRGSYPSSRTFSIGMVTTF